MKNTECENLNHMVLLSEKGIHTNKECSELYHRISDCQINCGEFVEQCREKVKYFLDKNGNHLNIK